MGKGLALCHLASQDRAWALILAHGHGARARVKNVGAGVKPGFKSWACSSSCFTLGKSLDLSVLPCPPRELRAVIATAIQVAAQVPGSESVFSELGE